MSRAFVVGALVLASGWTAASRSARADVLALPSGLRVEVDARDARAWTVARGDDGGDVLVRDGDRDASGDRAGGERLELAIAPVGEDRTCAAMLDGVASTGLAWMPVPASALGLPAVVYGTVRIDRSHADVVQRIACVQGAAATLTISWIAADGEPGRERVAASDGPRDRAPATAGAADPDGMPAGRGDAAAVASVPVSGTTTAREPDAARESTARVLGAVARAFVGSDLSRGVDARAASPAPPGAAASPLGRAAVPRAPSPAGPHRELSGAPLDTPVDELGRPTLPGAALLVPRLELGYLRLAPARASMPGTAGGASGVLAAADRPIVPFGHAPAVGVGYEAGAVAGADASGAFALAAHAGLGYHILQGVVGIYAIGGVGVDYLGGGPMAVSAGAAPDVYGAAVLRTFPTPQVLLEVRAARLVRLGQGDETEGTFRLAWSPTGRRAYLLGVFARDYGSATLFGTTVGLGF